MQKVVIKNEKVVSVSGHKGMGPLLANLNEGNTEKDNTNNQRITKTDSKTNIKLEASSGIIPDNTVMNITEISSGTAFDNIKNNIVGIKNFKAFDITLKSNNENIQPNGKVKISIPIPVGFDTSKLVVYRIDENNNKTEYQVTVVNNYAIFETDHFSTYVLGEKTELADEIGMATEKQDNKLPQTGEEINRFTTWLSITIILGILWICSMLLIEHEKKKMLKK